MNGERWQRLEELYRAALERAPHERAAFLTDACSDDELRREVESLVAFEPATSSVLDRPAWETRLTAGARLGPYEILEKIGAGGMGEVWKARDTRVGRTVAVKVCAQRFSERFEREARAIAALNHPHVCTLHDVGANYLVMEYVEGRPLKGPQPVAKAVEYARQILQALDAAHRAGIVHRDLKPANILVAASGVKLLDFGLAKVYSKPESAVAGETGTMALTDEHAIVGTPQYMAPEQIEGSPVDGRTDMFAFGCVLHELLTGRPAFEGKTASGTMAAVLASDPVPVSKLQPSVPMGFDRIVKTCLAKEPQERFQTAGEALWALDWALQSGPAPQPPRSYVPWAVAGLLAAAGLLALAGWWNATRVVEHPLVRLSVDLGPDALAGGGNSVVISPDGRRLVFAVRTPDGKEQLAMRLLDHARTTPLPGTENGRTPFFSPDSLWVGFIADGTLKKIPVEGGVPVRLCGALAVGGSWSESGEIFASPSVVSPLIRVSASGGSPRRVTNTRSGEVTHRWPQVLPGGQAVLFTAASTPTGMDDAAIQVLSLKTGETRVLLRGGYYGRYVPGGYLLFVHDGTLMGVRFDADRLETRGTPTPLLQDIAANPLSGLGHFDFSGSTLIYLAGPATPPGSPIRWLESSGATRTFLSTPGVYSHPRLSPDGQRVAFVATAKGTDIFSYDPQRDSMTRLTFDGHASYPIWSPDGRHIAYQSTSGGFNISWVRTDGAGEPQQLLHDPHNLYPTSFSPDGRRLAYHVQYDEPMDDIWTLPLDTIDPDRPKPGKPELFLHGAADNQFPVFSPDGRWIAYRSSESGSWQIYVRPFPGPGGKWQISTEGGIRVYWSKTARQLFYRTRDLRMMVLDYTADGDSFAAGKPRPWSDVPMNQGELNLDLAPDGKRFVEIPQQVFAAAEKGSVHVTFLLNFLDELRRRVPAGAK